MGIYIFLILFIYILGYIMKPNKIKENRKFYIIIIFSCLAIISAIRDYTVGVDTWQFCADFLRIGEMSFIEAIEKTRYEIGFITLCKILYIINTNEQILIIVTSIFIMGAVGKYIYEESTDVIMSSLIFVLLNCYAMYMSVMRQAIAISIILMAYVMFLKNDKKVKYIISVIIASFFHGSAIFMLILLLLKDRKFEKKYYYVAILVAIVSFVFSNMIFDVVTLVFPTYAGYKNSSFFASNYFASLINAIVALAFFSYGIMTNKDDDKDREKKNFYSFLILFNFLFYVLTVKINIFARVTTYFNVFNIIWIPMIIDNLKKNRNSNRIIIISCLALYWLVVSIYRPEWYGVIPYITFWGE